MGDDNRRPLGRILIQQQAISQPELDRALREAPDGGEAPLASRLTESGAISEVAALKALAAGSGLDADCAEAAWNDPVWKLRLKTENESAIAAGVFGAPFFVVDGETFWGNDRKAQIERWLSSGPF